MYYYFKNRLFLKIASNYCFCSSKRVCAKLTYHNLKLNFVKPIFSHVSFDKQKKKNITELKVKIRGESAIKFSIDFLRVTFSKYNFPVLFCSAKNAVNYSNVSILWLKIRMIPKRLED